MIGTMLDANLLIGVALKSVVVAGAGLATLRLTTRRSAAERSLIGHLGLVALVALPVASLLLPNWNPLPAAATVAAPALHLPAVTALPAGTAAAGAIAVPPSTSVWTITSASDLAVWLYLVPLVLLLLTMIVAVIRLGAMHRRANVLVNPSWQAALAMAQRRMGLKHGTALLVSQELRSPVS